MVTLKVKENSKQAKAFLELIKAFPFVEVVGTTKKTAAKETNTYSAAFVAKMKQAEKNIREGKTTAIDPNDVWGSLGLK